MSFDIVYQTTRVSDRPSVRVNPLTGAAESVAAMEPLGSVELAAVRGVLSRAGVHTPDEFGCYVVDLPDRGGAEVYGGRLETGCMASVRGLTPDLVAFLYDLLCAASWVMLPAMEDPVTITSSPEIAAGVPADFPRAVVCRSAHELGVLLTGGVRAWQTYRDQVVGGG